MGNDLPSNLRPTQLDSDEIRKLFRKIEERASPEQPHQPKSSTDYYKEEYRKRSSFNPDDPTTANSKSDSASSESNSTNTDSKKLIKGFIIFLVIIALIAITLYVVKKQIKLHKENLEKLKAKGDTANLLERLQSQDVIKNLKIFGEISIYFLGLFILIIVINKIVKASYETVG